MYAISDVFFGVPFLTPLNDDGEEEEEFWDRLSELLPNLTNNSTSVEFWSDDNNPLIGYVLLSSTLQSAESGEACRIGSSLMSIASDEIDVMTECVTRLTGDLGIDFIGKPDWYMATKIIM